MIISEEINQRSKQPKRHVEQDLRPDRPLDEQLDEQLDGLHDEQLQRVLLLQPLRPSERQDLKFNCQTCIDVQNGKFIGSINRVFLRTRVFSRTFSRQRNMVIVPK